jgi:predicted ABC-type ATPase
MEKPLLVVVAGPNGAGKTTFVEKASHDILSKTIFVNADNIAKTLKEKYPEKKEEHINLMSGKEAIKLYEKYLSEKKSFSMETTLSGNSPIQYLKKAKECGFETSLFYIGIQSPANSKVRIENRVLRGGHNIPDEDIIRRHGRSMKNLSKAIEYCDKTKIYDNTFNKHQLLFELDGKLVQSIENIKNPPWVQEIINPASLKLGREIEFIV